LQAIQQQVDDYLVKPADTEQLVEKIKAKLAERKSVRRREPRTRRLPIVILENRESIIQSWLAAVKEDPEISVISVTDSERVDRVPSA
jgi:YesN/AraC family two-component response regulator